jgi:tRNA nucleotidyltransferase (CCA-adding enzyme)
MASLQTAMKIVSKLKENGFDAYIVGGAVRDFLLHIESNDIDITSSAKPHQVMKIFEDTRPTGIKYGTVTVYERGEGFEVTTFRTDGPAEDNRHPDYIVYGDQVEEDVIRRDFTINGILMNDRGDIIDHVHGKEDLKTKTIKTIGEPMLRFSEDALRMLRACYFQAKLNFDIDQDTLKAMTIQGGLLKTLPSERVFNELIKLLKSTYSRKALKTMQEVGYDTIIPGLEKTIAFYLDKELDTHIDPFFAMAMYFHEKDMNYWPFSNKHRHKYMKAAQRAKEKRAISKQDLYEDGLEIMTLAGRLLFMLYGIPFKSKKIQEMYENLPIKSVVDLKIKPKEMMALSHKKAGAWIKEIQEDMVKRILKGELNNTRETLFVEFRMTYMKGMKA